MEDLRNRGVYGCFINGILVYVGSSRCDIDTLANNHLHWRSKYGELGRTHFRTELTKTKDNVDNVFRWLLTPAMRTARQVEALEGDLIRALTPKYNIDMDPVGSSIKYGRYSQIEEKIC